MNTRKAGLFVRTCFTFKECIISLPDPISKASIKSSAPHKADIGQWQPATSTTQQETHSIDVTKHIRSAGEIQALFEFQRGAHRLDIHKVELLEDNQVVATDEHFGHTGGQHVNNLYRLKLKTYNERSQYTLRYTSNTDGGTDSTGTITLCDANL